MYKALLVRVKFSEAFFRVHYTQGFRLTYPVPLPTTVAGIFGGMLGIKREEINQKFSGMMFGATALRPARIVAENSTFVQYKSARLIEKGVAPVAILCNPEYRIAMAGSVDKVEEAKEILDGGVVYIPYGGQNDFFCEDWAVEGLAVVKEGTTINNYAPEEWVEKIYMGSSSNFEILPVMHKISKNPNFYFVVNGTLYLKKTLKNVDGMGLYYLGDFIYQFI